jgi:hypothetical protein
MKEQSKETERLMKERSEETERKFQESERLMKERSEETERKFQESERLMKERSEENERLIKERSEENERLIKERSEENERLIKEWSDKIWGDFSEKLKKTERLVDRIGKQIGDVNNKFGRLSEEMVAPSLKRVFNELGFHINDRVSQNIEIFDTDNGNKLTEIDMLLENGESVIAVEIKTNPKEKHIEHHVNRLKILRAKMDAKNDSRRIYGAIAGAVFDRQVKEQTVAAGLYAVVQSGDTMKIEVPEGFTPAVL